MVKKDSLNSFSLIRSERDNVAMFAKSRVEIVSAFPSCRRAINHLREREIILETIARLGSQA